MAIIKGDDLEHVKNQFAGLKQQVTLLLFTQKMECMYCQQTHELMNEIAAISDKVTLEVYDFEDDTAKVTEYGIDKIPAVAIANSSDTGMRFFGIPAGYEFMALLEAIRLAGTGQSTLTSESKQQLTSVKNPTHIQVFVSPTCPYCTRAVSMAHSFASESANIRADMVEISEFPHLANKYDVFSVPKVVINESIEFEGAVPEQVFLDQVMKAQG